MMKRFGRSIQFACVALLMCAAFVLGQPKKPASQPADPSPELKSQIERSLAKAREQNGGKTPVAYITQAECLRLRLSVVSNNVCPSYHACLNRRTADAICTSD